MATEEARFSIPIDSDYSEAEQAARALEDLRRKISGGTERLKEMQAAQKRLGGTTLEAAKAQAELQRKIDAERAAISAAQLRILSMGTSFEKLTSASKRAADARKKLDGMGLRQAETSTRSLSSAVTAAGGPIANLRARFETLREVAGSGGALGIVTLGVVGLIAVVAALAVKVGGAAVSFARWAFESANAARTAGLLREAVTGSAADAGRLGDQVAALARKVATPRAALNELAVSLRKGGLSGQTLVDTLNAIGQAGAAVGDDTGNKLRELAERGRLTGRFQVAPQELMGSGVEFDDIAKALASSMKVGVADARKALFEGRVKLADGAAAMRKAVEEKFGGLNLRKMLDLNVAAEKFKETLDDLTKGIDLEPLLRGVRLIGSAFDTSTVTGAAMREAITLLGSALAKTFEKGAPIVKKFVQGMVIGFLQLTIFALRLRKSFRETFGDVQILKGIDLMTVAVDAGKFAIVALAAVLGVLAAAVGLVVGAFVAMQGIVVVLPRYFERLGERIRAFFVETDWVALGMSIVDGVVGGIRGGFDKAVSAVRELGERIKGAFTGKLEIRSPSRVFARYADNVHDGFTDQIERRTPEAAEAVDGMASVTPSPSAAPGSLAPSGKSGDVYVTIEAPGATKEAVDAMADESFLRQLVAAIRDGNQSMGGLAPA